MTSAPDIGVLSRCRLKPIDRLGRWASGLIGVTGVTGIIMGAACAWNLYLLVQIRHSLLIPEEYNLLILEEQGFQPAGVLVALSTIGFLFNLMAAGIAFLFWVYRAAANARVIRPGVMAISPGWAVGWYFVPIWSFWKPYQALRQIWRASNDVDAPGSVPLPKSIFRWWACWMIAIFYAAIVFVNGFLREFPEDASGLGEFEALINAYGSSVAGSVFMTAACYFLFKIVREITGAQATLASNTPGIFE